MDSFEVNAVVMNAFNMQCLSLIFVRQMPKQLLELYTVELTGDMVNTPYMGSPHYSCSIRCPCNEEETQWSRNVTHIIVILNGPQRNKGRFVLS